MLLYFTNTRMKSAMAAGAYPALVTSLFFLYVVLWKLLSLPGPVELIELTESLFHQYGWWIVGVAALLEGVAVINLYFPGSLVIILGVASSAGNPPHAIGIVATIMVGFALAALVNYGLGYFGLHQLLLRIGGKQWFDYVRTWHAKHGTYALLVAYIHPNAGGLMAMASGNARYPLPKFIPPVFGAIVFWNTCWGIAAYWLSPTLKGAASTVWPIVGVLVLWVLIRVGYELLRAQPPTY